MQVNQSRFNTFDDLLEEITRYVEHKTGKSLKIVSAASALANQNALGDPMGVSSAVYKGSMSQAMAILESIFFRTHLVPSPRILLFLVLDVNSPLFVSQVGNNIGLCFVLLTRP